MKTNYTYEELLGIIEALRGENGCPWDKEQTHDSLVPCLLEESYELVEAIQNEDIPNTKEELGDVLLQVLMHAQIAKEEGEYTIEEIIDELAIKLVFRHPHVFGGQAGIKSAEDVTRQWEAIKKVEKNEKTTVEALERVPRVLPALMRAQKLQKKVRKLEGETIDPLTTLNEVIKGLESFKLQMEECKNLEIEEEIGDILFGIVNLATFFSVNAEFALTKSLEKFINRFRYIEN